MACRDATTPVSIVTKGPMVVRDLDVLRAIAATTRCTVYLSVPSLDHDAWQRLEPGTASPLQRLRAVRTLVDAGIHCGVLMAPLVPGITTRRSLIEDTVKAAAEHTSGHQARRPELILSWASSTGSDGSVARPPLEYA